MISNRIEEETFEERCKREYELHFETLYEHDERIDRLEKSLEKLLKATNKLLKQLEKSGLNQGS